MQLSEEDMREALGLSLVATTPVKNYGSKEKRVFPHILVSYSVRKPVGGPAFRFDFKSRSISKDVAKLEAEKEIKRQGLIVWTLLDVQDVS